LNATVSRLRSVLEVARLDRSLHRCFLTDPPCAAIYVKEDEIREVAEAIGRALREQGGQLGDPIATVKLAEYGGDWHILYWPDVLWIIEPPLWGTT
jgi:hypothetical protein